MHVELVLPGVFAAGHGRRLAAIELLLARGRRAAAGADSLHAWLADAFGLGEAPLAAGALTVLGSGGEAGDAWWVRADPVHLQLARDRLLVTPPSLLALAREEAEALSQSLDRHFAGALEISVCEPLRWSARLREDAALEAREPLELAGAEVPLEAPTRWHALVNEAQMVLHSHPVNEAREARGEPAVNSVWLWGAGRAPAGAASPWQSVAADDPVARGAARLAGARAAALPRSAHEWLQRLPGEGRHLALLDALRGLPPAAALEALEAEWFAPLLAALRAGRVGMVTLHVPDAPQPLRCETIRGDLRRFWRLPKPVAAYA